MKGSKLAKTKKVLKFIIRLALIIALFAEVYYKDWLTLVITSIAVFLTFLPEFIEKRYKIDIPEEFEIWILFFVYLSLYLGEVQNFYDMFWWWDILLHGFSAISVGLVGFVIMLYLQQGKELQAKPLLICFLAFCFAVAMGAIWEIFEFILDHTIGSTMQNNSLVDTMADLIVDSAGAIIGSASGYVYLKNKKSKWAFTISSFVNLNEFLFKR